MTPVRKDRPVPFDPASGSGSDGVELPPPEGEVVTVLADAGVRGDLWAERSAVALARAWGGRGRKVVLVDGDVETPSLHELLDVQNLEGISDALLYGASPERVTVSVAGEPFRFIPSGTVVADPAGFRGSDRWGGLLDGFRSREEVVILFLPAGGNGSALLAAQGDRVLRMARPGTPPPEGFPPSLLLHPVGAPTASADGAGAPEPVPGDDPLPPSLAEGREASASGAAADPEGASATASAPAGTPGTPLPVTAAPARSGPRPRSGGGRQKILLGALLLAVVIFLVAAWLGFIEVPGFPGPS
jgi:hypothetical protein